MDNNKEENVLKNRRATPDKNNRIFVTAIKGITPTNKPKKKSLSPNSASTGDRKSPTMQSNNTPVQSLVSSHQILPTISSDSDEEVSLEKSSHSEKSTYENDSSTVSNLAVYSNPSNSNHSMPFSPISSLKTNTNLPPKTLFSNSILANDEWKFNDLLETTSISPCSEMILQSSQLHINSPVQPFIHAPVPKTKTTNDSPNIIKPPVPRHLYFTSKTEQVSSDVSNHSLSLISDYGSDSEEGEVKDDEESNSLTKRDHEEDNQKVVCKKIRSDSPISLKSSSSLESLYGFESPSQPKLKSKVLPEYHNRRRSESLHRKVCSPRNTRLSFPSHQKRNSSSYSYIPSFTESYQESRHFLPSYNVSQLKSFEFSVGFIDTHCHLDFLFKRTNHLGSYKDYRSKFEDFPVSYEGCVAVFCDPFTFREKSMWKPIIEEDGVWATFGCHPHKAKFYDERVHRALVHALRHDKVIALGEIGLDYSHRNECEKTIQHRVFRRQLQMALDYKLPLVIHCRDAYDDCFDIMKEIVPDNYPIHLHCFADDWPLAKKWLDSFPKLFIGITNVVTYSSATCVHEVIENLPLDRLLLETDTPYFLPRVVPKSQKWSHPGMAIHVAAQVAAIKTTVTIDDVLKAVRKNTRSLYKI